MSPQLDQAICTKILIVNDTIENLKQLSKMLSREGYTVLNIASRKMTLKLVEIEQPDLILLSINTPDLDGYQFCQLLKENPKTSDIPVIFISAYDQLGYKLKAFEVGGADYISSPFQEQEILMRVKNQLLIQQQKKLLVDQNKALQAEIAKRKEVEQTLQIQIERERLLASVIQHIRQSLDIEEVMHTTVTEVRQILQSDRALIYKVEPDAAGIIVSESDADNVPNLQQYTLPEDIFPRSHHAVYLEGRVRVVIDIEQDQMAACLLETLRSIGVRSKLVVPIVINIPNHADSILVQDAYENVNTEAKLWGLLVFHQCFAPRIWETAEVELIQQLANQVAVAIQQSYLYQQLQVANQALEKIAITDPLTHVVNRRGFDQYLQKEWLRMLREQMPISLILCDIDYFKNYNDTYGHPAGDRCLFQVSGALRCQLKRPGDMVARYGGEEFVIVLPNTNESGAIQIAMEIRQEIDKISIPHEKSLIADYVTLSFGIVSTVPQYSESPQILIDLADQALYQAKAKGRNRYCIYSPEKVEL